MESAIQQEYTEHQNQKYKLVSNTHEIVGQGNKIQQIKAMGFDTANLMKQSNVELRSQRDTIGKINNSHSILAMEVEQSEKVLRRI